MNLLESSDPATFFRHCRAGIQDNNDLQAVADFLDRLRGYALPILKDLNILGSERIDKIPLDVICFQAELNDWEMACFGSADSEHARFLRGSSRDLAKRRDKNKQG